MSRIVFGIEADDLLLDKNRFDCAFTYDLDTEEYKGYKSNELNNFINKLNNATLLVGHNIISYDLEILKKVGNFKYDGEIIDTILLAKLVDYDKPKSWKYSLEEYGRKLRIIKGKYSKDCKQDLIIVVSLYKDLIKRGSWVSKKTLDIEQEVQKIIIQQYINGWKFDEKSAQQLHIELEGEKEEALDYLLKKFKPKFIKKGNIKKANKPYKRLGITTFGEYQPIELKEFNPSSGIHIVHWIESELGKQDWYLTKKGNPKTDRDSLKDMFNDEPFIEPLLHYLEVNKLLSQLATGDMAWLKHIKEDRIHGSMDILGTNTGRATHSNPNLGQVPSKKAYKGKETRELFISKEGYSNVGCDLSGVELRCLAHFLEPYDKGRYKNIILEGDIHTANQEAAGLETRDLAKTFIYAIIYGGGDKKIGSIIGKGAKEGRILKSKFLRGTPGYKQLLDKVKKVAKERGYLIGISGRRIHIRSLHSALNALLQSLGGYISKYWLVEVWKRIRKENIDCYQIGWIHDELQFECLNRDTKALCKILEESSLAVGKEIGVRIPINSESAIGNNWYEVH